MKILYLLKKKKNEDFFENLTMVPIDKELIDISILSKNEKKWINSYHKKVLKNLKAFMQKNEILELKKACSSI